MMPIKSKSAARLEVHEHWFISGPRAHHWDPAVKRIAHSHEGGDVAHKHEDTGPATFTIDKDEWLRNTGLTGGGRKKFTAKPKSEQFPVVELEDWQKSFEIIVHSPGAPEGHKGEGPGLALPLRMIRTFGMTCTVRST